MTNETTTKETCVDAALGKPESIRQWYDRTTKPWRKGLGAAAVATLFVMVAVYFTTSVQTLAHIQTFNGALTIPIWGGLWVLSFIFMFLIPSREASFRGQEAIERAIVLLTDAIEKKLSPAMDTWKKLGEQIQAELDKGLVTELRAAADKLKAAADKVQASAQTSNGELQKLAKETKDFADEAKPALQALKRIQAKIEYEVNDGFFEKVSAAMESVRNMSLPASKTEKPHDPGKALDMLRRGKAAPAPVVVGPPRAVPVASQVPPVQS